jgi:hypothetical protein
MHDALALRRIRAWVMVEGTTAGYHQLTDGCDLHGELSQQVRSPPDKATMFEFVLAFKLLAQQAPSTDHVLRLQQNASFRMNEARRHAFGFGDHSFSRMRPADAKRHLRDLPLLPYKHDFTRPDYAAAPAGTIVVQSQAGRTIFEGRALNQ